jgi:hypothetical protein
MLNLAESARPSPELTIAYTNAYAVAGVLPSPRLAEIYRKRALDNMVLAPDAIAETYFLTLSGVYLTGIGAWDDALATLSKGLSIAEQLNFTRRAREIFGAIGLVHFYRGDYTLAGKRAEAQQAVAAQKDPQSLCWALLGRAQILLIEGKPEAALRNALATTELLSKLGRAERIWSNSILAAAYIQVDDARLADEASRRALSEIEATPTLAHYNIDAYRACAEVRLSLAHGRSAWRSDDAERLANGACRALSRLARVFPIAQPRSLLLNGVREVHAGRRDRALQRFKASLDVARRLDMRYDCARARLALATLGADDTTGKDNETLARADLVGMGADFVTAAPL